MNFRDSSALIPLVTEQQFSKRAESLYSEDKQGVYVWWGTMNEYISALSRLERSSDLTSSEVENALTGLRKLSKSWNIILPSDQVRDKANRLISVHPLRAADSFQLASAIIASEDLSSKILFMTFNERLAVAARKEGFEVVG